MALHSLNKAWPRNDKAFFMSNLLKQAPYQKGQKPEKSAPIRQASQDQTCTLMIPGICEGQTSTVVGCHLRLFGIAGAAQKPDDIFIVDGCAKCHAILDDRSKWADAKFGWDDILRALMLTLKRRRASGLITLAQTPKRRKTIGS